MKRFLALLIATMLLVCAGAAAAETLKCPNCGAEFDPELDYIYCPFCATPLSKASVNVASDVKAGGIITFGRYEQDNNLDNGPESIEWIVLDIQDGKALLLSKYGLDAKPYNIQFTEMTWENCTLRAWLNDDFLNTAFSTEEQSAILSTEVDNSVSQGYEGWSTNGGNNTKDYLFLLSYVEANRYLGVKYWEDDDENNILSRVAPTEYAINNGAWTIDSYITADGKPAGWWWFRSPGDIQRNAASVRYGGSLYGIDVDIDNGVVRPAFWLNLESAVF